MSRKAPKSFPLDRYHELVGAISDMVESDDPVIKRAGVACALGLEGLRVGEVCQSPWEHFDPASKSLYVLPWVEALPPSKRHPNGRQAGYYPLKHGEERTVYLDQTVVDALFQLREYYPKDSRWLISTKYGTQVKRQQISKYGKKLFMDLGIPPHLCRFHMLRHTSAMKVKAETGNDLLQVQYHMGHKSLMTTQIYLTVEKDRPESSKVKLRTRKEKGLKRLLAWILKSKRRRADNGLRRKNAG